MKRFLVVSAAPDGGVELHRMKEWLRQNPEYVPAGLHATQSTSHQLRLGLRKNGWGDQETDTEIRMIRPDVKDDIAANAVLGSNLDISIDEDREGSYETAFELEYQLRDFIASNIEGIRFNQQRLKLYVDPAGRDGIEYPTAVGPIDILAVDEETGAFVVFELKRGKTPDHVIGQIARYMGWLKSTLAKQNDVQGVIVAKQIAQNLRYAIKAVPNVSLFEYEVSFALKAADAI